MSEPAPKALASTPHVNVEKRSELEAEPSTERATLAAIESPAAHTVPVLAEVAPESASFIAQMTATTGEPPLLAEPKAAEIAHAPAEAEPVVETAPAEPAEASAEAQAELAHAPAENLELSAHAETAEPVAETSAETAPTEATEAEPVALSAQPEIAQVETVEPSAQPELAQVGTVALAAQPEIAPAETVEPVSESAAAEPTEPLAEAVGGTAEPGPAEAIVEAEAAASEKPGPARSLPPPLPIVAATTSISTVAVSTEAAPRAAAASKVSIPPPLPKSGAAFTTSGSDFPVVLSAPPAPYAGKSRSRRLLPRATIRAQKLARSAPLTLLVLAPFVGLFAIWLVRGVTHHDHAAQSSAEIETRSETPANSSETRTEDNGALSSPNPKSSDPLPAVDVPSATVTRSEPIARAEDMQLKAAVTQGLPALQTLAEKYPTDPQVLVALAGAQSKAQRYEAATASIERALDAAPNAVMGGKIMGILWRAAQSSALESSFACLRKLGARGSDVAFDLATTAGVRETVRGRARAELSKHLAVDASADTRAASLLLLAPDCATRRDLLDRAAHEGGKRTRGMLERYLSGFGCDGVSAKGGCNACFTGSTSLPAAIATLDAGAKP